MSARLRGPLTGRHVLIMLLAMFGIVILVNGIFTYFALSSHPGVVANDSYTKGLRFNTTLADAAAQRRRGWRSKVTFTPDTPRSGLLELRIVGANGAGINGLALDATLRRPAASDHDLKIGLAGSSDGRYQARLDLPLGGNWDVTFTGIRDGRRVFRLEYRLWTD